MNPGPQTGAVGQQRYAAQSHVDPQRGNDSTGDGKPIGTPVAARLTALPAGPEAYFSLGRDARWEHALPAVLTERSRDVRQ